jgi:hypothetical protein
VQLEHERDVLQEQPARPSATPGDEPKHVVDQARLFAVDAERATCLAEVLAREAGGDQLCTGRQSPESGHIGSLLDVGEVGREYCLGSGINLAEQFRGPTVVVKADLQAGDSSEQRNHSPVGHLRILPLALHCRM